MKEFDVLIMVTEKSLGILRSMIPYCRQNIKAKKIYLVAPARIRHAVEDIHGTFFVDETMVYPGLTLGKVETIMESISGKKERAGWYLQQFLKMAWAYKCEDEAYIVIDADTIPLNPLYFMNEDGQYLFTQKIEHHKPYFDTIDVLFSGDVKRAGDFSFIAEHMIFDRQIMKEMISKIEQDTALMGDRFFEKILRAIDPFDINGSGFSEFETYGNYMFKFYNDKVVLRKLRTQREAVFLLGSAPSKEQLDWAKQDYDIISIESPEYKRTIVTTLTQIGLVRKMISLRRIAKIRAQIRDIYRRILKKENFKYEQD